MEDSTKVSREPPMRPKRDEYNNERPLTLLMENVWVMSARHAAWDSRVLLRNGISTTVCVAPGHEARRRDRNIMYLDSVDANKICEGHVPVQTLFSLLVELYRAETTGAIGIYCRNGANRSPLIVGAYLMARAGLDVEKVAVHMQKLRAIVDLSTAEYGYSVRPMKFLANHEKQLHELFTKIDGFTYSLLPETATLEGFKALVERKLRPPVVNASASEWVQPRFKKAAVTSYGSASWASGSRDIYDEQPPRSSPRSSPGQRTTDEQPPRWKPRWQPKQKSE